MALPYNPNDPVELLQRILSDLDEMEKEFRAQAASSLQQMAGTVPNLKELERIKEGHAQTIRHMHVTRDRLLDLLEKQKNPPGLDPAIQAKLDEQKAKAKAIRDAVRARQPPLPEPLQLLDGHKLGQLLLHDLGIEPPKQSETGHQSLWKEMQHGLKPPEAPANPDEEWAKCIERLEEPVEPPATWSAPVGEQQPAAPPQPGQLSHQSFASWLCSSEPLPASQSSPRSPEEWKQWLRKSRD